MDTLHEELIFNVISFLYDYEAIRLSEINTTFRDMMSHYKGLTDTYDAIYLSVKHIVINNLSERTKYAEHLDVINAYHNRLNITYHGLSADYDSCDDIFDSRHMLTLSIIPYKPPNIIKAFLYLLTNKEGIFRRADVIFINTSFSLDEVELMMKGEHGISVYEFFKGYQYNVKGGAIASIPYNIPLTIFKKDKRLVLGKKGDYFELQLHIDYVVLKDTYYNALYCKNFTTFIKEQNLETSIVSISSAYAHSQCDCINDVTHIDLRHYANLKTFYYNGIYHKHAITTQLNHNAKYISIYNATVPIVEEYPLNVVEICTNNTYGLKDLIMRRGNLMKIYISLDDGMHEGVEHIDITYTKKDITILMYKISVKSLSICEELLSIELIDDPIIILHDTEEDDQQKTFHVIAKWLTTIRYKHDYTEYPRLIYALKNNPLYKMVVLNMADM